MIIPMSKATGGTRTTRTCSRAIIRSRAEHVLRCDGAEPDDRGRPPSADPDDAVREHRRGRSRSRSSAGRIKPRSTSICHAVLRPVPRRRRVSSRSTGGSKSRRSSTSTTSPTKNSASSIPTCSAASTARGRSSRCRNSSSRPSSPTSGPTYDFVSVRAGSQPFISDFRGFIFSDINLGVRLFGNRNSNREQFNLAYFDQREKDTNSGLNTFNDRNQQILIANYYLQDFIFPGYTAQASVHYNHDDPTFKFDKNNFLVRPDPVGVFQPHGARRRLPRLGRRRAHQPLQHHAPVLLGARPRLAKPDRRTRRRTSTPSSPPSNCPTTATGFASARRSCTPPATSDPNNGQAHRLRRHPRRSRTSPAANSATGSGRRSACSASNLVNRGSLVPQPAVEQDPGAEQLRQSRPASWSTSAWTSRSRRSAGSSPTPTFSGSRQSRVLQTFTFQKQIHRVHRHRPEHRRRVSAAAEQQRDHQLRRRVAVAGPRFHATFTTTSSAPSNPLWRRSSMWRLTY